MTFREQAAQIVFVARNLTEADAIQTVELELQLIHIKGEKAGIEAARQSISELGQEAA